MVQITAGHRRDEEIKSDMRNLFNEELKAGASERKDLKSPVGPESILINPDCVSTVAQRFHGSQQSLPLIGCSD